MRIGVIGGILLWVLVAVWLSGCAVPLLTGLKEYRTKEAVYTFMTGADFHIGANGIDTVNDKRSIEPKP